MKRRLILILTVFLLLMSVGCSRIPADEATGETTACVTDATDSSTQPQLESRPQTTLPDEPTEPQTQSTQPTQDNDAQDKPQNTQKPDTPDMTTPDTPVNTTPLPEQTPDSTPETTGAEETPDTTQETEATDETGCQHDYQQTYMKAATCTAKGTKKFTCIKCGAVLRQEIPMSSHNYQAASCQTPMVCTFCKNTDGAALGHSYGSNYLCTRCGAKNPNADPELMPVDFVATIRSDEGEALSGVAVTVYTAASGSSSAGSAVTDKNGKVTIALAAGSRQYTVKLSNIPEGYQVEESYIFSTAQVNIDLKSIPVRSDPNDHSRARYTVGDKMMEFTMTDVDGRTYKLSELLQKNKLVILDFWYVSCNPCKNEFPYFEAALDAYGDEVVLLAVDPFYSAEDIRQLRDDMDLSFPVFQDPLGLSGGFRVESYPTTVFIDSTGTIRKIHQGAYSSETAFLRAVEAYL